MDGRGRGFKGGIQRFQAGLRKDNWGHTSYLIICNIFKKKRAWFLDIVPSLFGENSSFMLYKPLFKLFSKETMVCARQLATLLGPPTVTGFYCLYQRLLLEWNFLCEIKKGRRFCAWTPHATWDAAGYPRYLHRAVGYKTGLAPSGEAAGDLTHKNEPFGRLCYLKRLVTESWSSSKKLTNT